MKKLLFIFSVVFAAHASAQNYNCLQPNAKNYFTNGYNYVRGIRIDSVSINGTDTVYHPYRSARISNYLPYPATAHVEPLGASWLGKNVIKHSDGTFVFDNMWDTVIIHSQANTGDSWTFFNDTTNISYIATVTAMDTMTVLGAIDSVKTITITADSAGAVNTNDPVNTFQIILSKNNGFVQVFDLYTFPYHYPAFVGADIHGFSHQIRFADWYLDVVLGNLGTCDLGCNFDTPPDTANSIFHLFSFPHPTTREIYNFAAGDVYESKISAGSSTYNYVQYILDSVNTRTVTGPSVSYTGMERTMKVQNTITGTVITVDTTYDSNSYAASGDTTLLVNSMQLPEETYEPHLLHYYPADLSSSSSCPQPALYQIDVDYEGSGFGYNGIAMEPSIAYTTYAPGFGIWKKYSYEGGFGNELTQTNIYYQKYAASCGGFVNVHRPAHGPNSVAVNNLASSIQISPNPANDHIDIIAAWNTGTTLSVAAYDMTGRCIYNAQADVQKKYTVNTANWINGVYLLTIGNQDGVLKREKITIMR